MVLAWRLSGLHCDWEQWSMKTAIVENSYPNSVIVTMLTCDSANTQIWWWLELLNKSKLSVLSLTTISYCCRHCQFNSQWLLWGLISAPPCSCWIPVIPVDSSGIPVEFTSQNFTPATKLCNSAIYTGMVPRVRSPEWHWNPVTGIEIKNSKYGNFCIFTWKIVIKSEKK